MPLVSELKMSLTRWYTPIIPATQEAEERSWRVQDQPGLHNELKISLGSIGRSRLK